MKQIYLLVPLLTCYSSHEEEIQNMMQIQSNQYEIYQFDNDKFCIQLKEMSLGYQQLQQILQKYDINNKKIAILEETLTQYDWNTKQNSIQAYSLDSLMKKAAKYKQIKQQNKKLKKLLQNQLQNTEKVRQQTQKTMKILRQQFQGLVRGMNKTYDKGGLSSRGQFEGRYNNH